MENNKSVKSISAEELEELLSSIKLSQAKDTVDQENDLLETHQLDSFSVVQLMLKLEEKLDIVFEYKDVNRQTFKSIHSILELLQKKYDITITT